MGAENEETLLAESKSHLGPPRRNKGTCLARLNRSKKPFREVGHASAGRGLFSCQPGGPSVLKATTKLGEK